MQFHKLSRYRTLAAVCFAIFAFLAFPPVSLFFTVAGPFFLAVGLLAWVVDGVISSKPPTP